MTNKIRLGLAIVLAPIAIMLIAGISTNDPEVVDSFLPLFWAAVPVGMIIMVWEATNLVRGPRKLLATGTLAVAELTGVRRTGTIINDVNLVVELTMAVRPEGSPGYEVTTKTTVPIHQPDLFTPGQLVAIRFDPRKPARVAVDLDPPADWLDHVSRPTASPITQDEILATGNPAIAQILGIQLTGKLAGQLGSANPEHPERASYPAIILELMVQPERDQSFTYQAVYAVPPRRATSLARDALVPVRYVHHAGQPLVAVDWERLPGTP